MDSVKFIVPKGALSKPDIESLQKPALVIVTDGKKFICVPDESKSKPLPVELL